MALPNASQAGRRACVGARGRVDAAGTECEGDGGMERRLRGSARRRRVEADEPRRGPGAGDVAEARARVRARLLHHRLGRKDLRWERGEVEVASSRTPSTTS